jgi:hypothetical protein
MNLGVIQENPSSIAGTITILERLQKYVPVLADTPIPVVVYGDALSCERHNDAHMARVTADTPLTRLEGVEPSPQEFHKRMLLLQVNKTQNMLFTLTQI